MGKQIENRGFEELGLTISRHHSAWSGLRFVEY